jgi:hypothetical protein
MSSGQQGWLFLMMLALFLIVIGIQGNLGVTFAVLFTPAYVTVTP